MHKDFDIVKKLISEKEYSLALEQLEKLNVKDLPISDRLLCEYYMGICYCEIGDIGAAIEKFQLCLNYDNDDSLSTMIPNFYYELSLAYFLLYKKDHIRVNLEKAIDYCKKSINTALKNPFIEQKTGFMVYVEKSPLAYIYMLIHLGVLNQEIGNLEESLKILFVSKTICQHLSRIDLLGQVYDEIGTTYLLLGEPELANYYYFKSIKAKKIIGNENGIEITLSHQLLCVMNYPTSINSSEAMRLRNLVKEERV